MTIHRRAILKADEIRTQLKLNMFEPVNIFDSCISLGIDVRFVDINMEGFYKKNKNGSSPIILLSNQRPLPRRCFTCAHELGHHVFGHGTTLDALSERHITKAPKDIDEQLVDEFAGALLIPLAGVQSEFVKRNWVIQQALPIQFYTISSIFGIGYQTLIFHSKANNLISEHKANLLLKFRPAKILETLLDTTVKEKSYFKVFDNLTQLSFIDLEVTNYIILPANIQIEGNHLKKCYVTNNASNVYVATKPGIVRAVSIDDSISYFIRIQNLGYVGLAENRHLENEID